MSARHLRRWLVEGRRAHGQPALQWPLSQAGFDGGIIPKSLSHASSPAIATAHAAPGSFRVVAGEDQLRVWKPQDGREKWLCGACGSALFAGNPNQTDPIGIRMGAFDRDPGIRPSLRMLVAYAAAWEPILAELGDDQAQADIELRERTKVAVAFVPATAVEVRAQRGQAALGQLSGHQVPGRAGLAHVGIKAHLRAIPKGAEESVLAQARDCNRLLPGVGEPGKQLFDRSHHANMDLQRSGEIVTNQPQLREWLGIEAEDDDAIARDAHHSASPASGSAQWWTVMIAIAASKVSSSNGRSSAVAWTTGVDPSRL